MKHLVIPQEVFDSVMSSLRPYTLGYEDFDFDEPIKESPFFSLRSVFLSPHFNASEVVHSVTAGIQKIPNEISAACLFNAAVLARDVLEPLRTVLGRPVHVSSWFRCPQLNQSVGGVRNSYHLYARAADIPLDFVELLKVLPWLRDNNIQHINYKTFVHVQV